MVSPLFFYQLGFLALLWLCIMLHSRWPSDRAAHRQSPSQPASPPHKRSAGLHPLPVSPTSPSATPVPRPLSPGPPHPVLHHRASALHRDAVVRSTPRAIAAPIPMVPSAAGEGEAIAVPTAIPTMVPGDS